MGQISRSNREQQRIRELEAELHSLHKQRNEKDEVIDILKNASASCRNHCGKIPLCPDTGLSWNHCGTGMPYSGDFSQRLL